MGKRGPKPKPTSILKLGGSWRGNINRSEPKPSKKKTVRAPSYLNDEAKKIWDRIVPVLKDMQVLTHADVHALARYCDAYVLWIATCHFLNENGLAYIIYETDEIGNETNQIRMVKKYPQADCYLKLSALLSRYEQEFGLTPSARSRITVDSGPMYGRNDGSKPDILRF